MTNHPPRVTIMIATKDRLEPLRLTLAEMRKQDYSAMDLLVIDDGSKVPVRPFVLEIWPEATVITHTASAGQCARRNQGFELATGEYILQLDDDCSFIGSGDLTLAARKLAEMPGVGAFSFYVINSEQLPATFDTSLLKSGCVAAFLGAAVLFRAAALSQTKGYRPFFENDWEEEELGLQFLKLGWQIVFVPEIVAHHRLSLLNRNSGRTWMRGLRNRLWALVIHMPLWRLWFEGGWKIAIGFWDALRLKRFGLFFRALSGAALGLRKAWGQRAPLTGIALRRYDALRLHPVLSVVDFVEPPKITWKLIQGFWRRWRNRARSRSVWTSAKGDVGTSYTVAYAHERNPTNATKSSVIGK